MNEEFRAMIRLGIARYEREGISCRPRTHEELEEYDSHLSEIVQPEIQQLPFSERVKQVREVQRIAKERSMLIIDACEEVGISFSNYKSVKAAHQKGLKKR